LPRLQLKVIETTDVGLLFSIRIIDFTASIQSFFSFFLN
jgi:hypothetical protein